MFFKKQKQEIFNAKIANSEQILLSQIHHKDQIKYLY